MLRIIDDNTMELFGNSHLVLPARFIISLYPLRNMIFWFFKIVCLLLTVQS
jgi:hypothetical protein